MLEILAEEDIKNIREKVDHLVPILLARYQGEEREEMRRELDKDRAEALIRLLEEVELVLRP